MERVSISKWIEKFNNGDFINDNVQITDLGGIELADDVLIGPGAMLLSVNHPLDPAKRHAVEVQPIHIERNAWIGADRSNIHDGISGEELRRLSEAFRIIDGSLNK